LKRLRPLQLNVKLFEGRTQQRLVMSLRACVIIIIKSFRKDASNIPENHEVKELQKTATLGTAHILRKVLT
jgi:hypothetical protein